MGHEHGYRDHTPDLLFVQDVAPQNEMITDQYYKNQNCVGEWNEIPMEMWEMMKHGLARSRLKIESL